MGEEMLMVQQHVDEAMMLQWPIVMCMMRSCCIPLDLEGVHGTTDSGG
jgi:hypothetical protein